VSTARAAELPTEAEDHAARLHLTFTPRTHRGRIRPLHLNDHDNRLQR